MSNELLRTPLYAAHRDLGARLVPFAGYEMPVQYPDGITAEHRRVRESAGVFDVSHMGTVRIRGPGALACLQFAASNDAGKLAVGAAQYSLLLTEDGGILDDLLIFRLSDEEFLLVVNAANRSDDVAAIRERAERFDVRVEDTSDDTAILAVQGPGTEEALRPLVEDADLTGLGYYRFVRARVGGRPAIVSRTGYTGEDGFELYLAADEAREVWDALLEREGVGPAGLGARDTLRLEVGYPLHGNDIDRSTGPYSAGLGWVVKPSKGEFVGRAAVVREKEDGPARKLIGFRLLERGFPRAGYTVRHGEGDVGKVTSGAVGPSVGEGIGMAYLPAGIATPGERVEIVIRNRPVAAELARPPFYTSGSIRR